MATAREIAVQVLSLIQATGQNEPNQVFLPDIARLIPNTIKEMVLDIVMTGKPDERKLFTKEFTGLAITPVANDFDTVNLASLLSAAEPILLDLPFPAVKHPNSPSFELLRVADLQNLAFAPLNEGYDHYAVSGATLYINASPELTGNISIWAFFVPSVANLHKQFEPALINRLLIKLGMAMR